MSDKRYNLNAKLSYIAGFVDGEGCIRIKKANQYGNSYYVTFQVTNSDPRPLHLIRALFGGKVYHQEKAKNKVIWQYYASCNDAVDALRTLLGHLISKKDQADLAIKFHDGMSGLRPDEKLAMHNKMRDLKLVIHENPELVK